jgi:hypothetical protein
MIFETYLGTVEIIIDLFASDLVSLLLFPRNPNLIYTSRQTRRK